MEKEIMIKNSTEAKELLLGAATALESPSTGWSENAIAKIRFLAEQIEKDLGANDDFNLEHESHCDNLIKLGERIDELQKLQRRHLCPYCKTVWLCFDETCKTDYQMLCDAHDREECRKELGGKWME